MTSAEGMHFVIKRDEVFAAILEFLRGADLEDAARDLESCVRAKGATLPAADKCAASRVQRTALFFCRPIHVLRRAGCLRGC